MPNTPTNEEIISKLQERIKELEGQLQITQSNIGFGLKWENKKEIFDEKAENALPVLVEDKGLLIDNGSNLDHIIIEGDNYHSLSALNYTHKGKIDIIYIDPPYNTGNKNGIFIYNDDYVDKNDTYRHSKWLSFMEKRLRLAKNLLSPEGVIFISIDDNEQAQLKLLCDSIFGEENKLGGLTGAGEIIWCKGNSDEASDNLSKNHEYILCYRRSDKVSISLNKEKSTKVIYENGEYYIDKGENVGFGMLFLNIRPTLGYTVYYNPETGDMIGLNDYDQEKAKTSNSYNEIYKDNTDLIKKGYIAIRPAKNGKTGKIKCRGSSLEDFTKNKSNYFVTKLKTGRYSVNKKEFVDENDVIEKDGNFFLKTAKKIPLPSVVYRIGSGDGTSDFNNIMGEVADFNNPKPVALMLFLLQAFKEDATVLDFFAGSGTMGEAVLYSNKFDGCRRKFILCSNKESTRSEPDKNVCRNVTYERVKRALQGFTNAKGQEFEGLGGSNIRYYTTDFIPKDNSIDDLRFSFMNRCDELLCLRESCFNKSDSGDNDFLKVYENGDKKLVILYDTFYIEDLKEYLKNCEGQEISVYLFTLSKEMYEEEIKNINKGISIQNIPDEILETYQKIFIL